MLFNSIEFMFFFPIAVLGYYVVPKKIRYIWLLICSYYFYMSWNPEYALLMLTSTGITYLGSRIIGTNLPGIHRKVVLIAVLIANLGILGYFKYSNFFIEWITFCLQKINITVNIPQVDVLLPVGISFYTFQALSYSIDVYRGDIKAEKNFLKYAVFVSFFPQLVAGPIERSKNLLLQIQEDVQRKADVRNIFQGLLYMLWGLFLKMVIADRIVILVDTVFEHYYLYGGVELIAGAVAFAIQIYCDFASYSIIAIGAAKVLGYSLMENFDAPYLSRSIKEFWRRWHISLSAWFRDYLYIPLGGSRCTKIHKYFNLMVTFLVSGLWHGAAMTYVVWGGIHGAYQIVGEILQPIKKKVIYIFHVKTECFSYKLGQTVVTFVLVDFALIFFRADGIQVALSYIKRIFTDFNLWVLSNGGLYLLGLDRTEMNILFISLLVLVLADLLKYYKRVSIVDFVMEQNVIFQYICIVLLILSIFIFGAYGPAFDAQKFIYFQF